MKLPILPALAAAALSLAAASPVPAGANGRDSGAREGAAS